MVTRASNPNHYLHRVGMTQQEAQDYVKAFRKAMSGSPLVDLKGVPHRGHYAWHGSHTNTDAYFADFMKKQDKLTTQTDLKPLTLHYRDALAMFSIVSDDEHYCHARGVMDWSIIISFHALQISGSEWGVEFRWNIIDYGMHKSKLHAPDPLITTVHDVAWVFTLGYVDIDPVPCEQFGPRALHGWRQIANFIGEIFWETLFQIT